MKLTTPQNHALEELFRILPDAGDYAVREDDPNTQLRGWISFNAQGQPTNHLAFIASSVLRALAKKGFVSFSGERVSLLV